MDNPQKQRGFGSSIVGMMRLVRPLNCTITAISIASMGLIAHIPERMFPALLMAAAAGFLMTAFGNASNDYLDIEIDKINRPDRPLPSGQVTLPQALTVVLFALAGAVFLGFRLGATEFLFITLTAALLAGYNAFLKRIPLAGNATVGLLTGMAFVFGGIAIGSPGAALFPALFAFLINMLRELLKDAEDVEGDSALLVATFPRVWGMEATRLLATALATVLVTATSFPYLFGLYNAYYAVIVAVAVDLPLIAGISYLWNLFSRQRIKRMSILLKYLMITGLVAIVFGTLSDI